MILEKIVRDKILTVEKEKKETPIDKIDIKSYKPKDFRKAITRNKINIVAEFKRKSPSKGLLNNELDPIKVAKTYENSNVAAISVLTEEKYFGGSIKDLQIIRNNTSIPILRKDFIIDEYQIYQSFNMKADCILLIASILNDDQLKRYKDIAFKLGLSIIFEAHTIGEVSRGIDLGFEIIGINNRNLKTFEVDLNNTKYLSKAIPEDITIISESGIFTRQDIQLLEGLGVDAVLIGESLIKSENIKDKINYLRGDISGFN